MSYTIDYDQMVPDGDGKLKSVIKIWGEFRDDDYPGDIRRELLAEVARVLGVAVHFRPASSNPDSGMEHENEDAKYPDAYEQMVTHHTISNSRDEHQHVDTTSTPDGWLP